MNIFWSATTISSLDYGCRFKTKDNMIFNGALKTNLFCPCASLTGTATHFPAPALISVEADSKAVWF